MKESQLEVKGIDIHYHTIKQEDYISLTNIAKIANANDPSGVIRN